MNYNGRNIKESREKKHEKLLLVGAIVIGSLGFNKCYSCIKPRASESNNKKRSSNGQVTKFELDKENGKKSMKLKLWMEMLRRNSKIDAETGEIVRI